MAKRVILDTNIIISYLISDHFKSMDDLITSSKITIVLSESLIEEVYEVSKRPKFRKFFKTQDILDFFALIEDHSEMIEPISIAIFHNDPKDEFLISLAVDSKADFMITGDKALLELGIAGKTRIISFTDFLKVKV